MAEETKLVAEIDAQVSGDADAKALADALATVGEALNNLVTDAKKASSVLSKVEKGVTGVSSQAKKAQGDVNNLNKSLQETAKLQNKSTAGEFAATRNKVSYGLNPDFQATREKLGINPDVDTLKKSLAQESSVFAAAKAKETAAAKAFADYQTASNARIRASEFTTISSVTQIQRSHQQSLDESRAAYGRAEKAMLGYRDGLANTRYALYGLSNALGVAGLGIVAANVGVIAAAASFQTAFANISRTAGVSGAALTDIEDQFVSLGQTIPESYANLSEIATLAGQLNIPAQNIAAFTKSTAQFSATTNVTTEAAATAFGRLDALLPDVKGNYDALGSSILNVGVNSVATESDIINTTSQIAAAGQQAGLTADQIIGLAASYASLGVAPEAARGSTIRVFSTIRTATLEGGAALEQFAKLSGESADQFKADWNANAGDTFVKVLQGLNSEGANAETTLRGVGITAVRDINALLKLSQNVQLVGDNFGYAADGFSNATQLGSSFAKITDTVAAKAQELLNSLQALFGELGSGGLTIISGLIDGLKGFIVLLTDAAKNPFVQSIATTVGALTAFSGVLLLVTSGFGRLVAAMLAGRPVLNTFGLAMDAYRAKLKVVVAENIAAGASMSNLATRSKAAGLAIGGALKGVGIAAGVTLAIGLATTAVDQLNEALKSGEDRAKDAFGGFDDLSAALREDSKTYDETGDRFGKVAGSITSTKTVTDEWVNTVENATGGAVQLGDANQNLVTSTDAVTFSIGKQTAALLANKLANDTSIQELIKRNGVLAQKGYEAPDISGALTAAAQNDTAKAKKIIDDYQKYVDTHGAKGFADVLGGDDAQSQLDRLKKAVDLVTGSLQGASAQTQIQDALNKALGVSSSDAADGVDELSSATSTLSQIQDAFASSNAIASMASDFYTLVYALQDGAVSFNEFDQSGQQNLSNLQSTIASSIDAAASLGVNATEAVALVFQQLQQQGVDTAALLASLAGMGIPGVNIGGVGNYLNGTTQMDAAGKRLQQSLNGVTDSARKTAQATKSVGGAAGGAAAQVYTLVNYASDLSSVFKRATDIRFGSSDALDKITTGWKSIADATADANKKIKDAQATLQQLASDKSIDTYFLGVAQAYGDTLRAGEIQADLAKNAQDTADANKDLADAQVGSSKELEGNSAAAIANRATLEGLVGSYQDYISSLASSGADQATLNAAVAQSKQQFIQQATQMGFNVQQVGKFAASFDDLTTAINLVPRKITVTANASPAQQAINEFLANNRNGKGASGGVSVPINVGSTGDPWQVGVGIGNGIRGGVAAAISAHPFGFQVLTAGQPVYNIPGTVLKLYKSGGYTGDGGTSAQAGIVHGKEFVVDAANTSRLGLPFLNALNSGKTPVVAGQSGGGIQMVELTASNLATIVDALSVRLQIGNKVIQQASDTATLNAANRGTN